MTITDYLSGNDYYLDPEAADGGWIRAVKESAGGKIIVHKFNERDTWAVLQFTPSGLIGSKSEFHDPKPSAVIAYLRALEQP